MLLWIRKCFGWKSEYTFLQERMQPFVKELCTNGHLSPKLDEMIQQARLDLDKRKTPWWESGNETEAIKDFILHSERVRKLKKNAQEAAAKYPGDRGVDNWYE